MILNRTYTYNVTNFVWGDLPQSVLVALFRDGRTCAPFIQQQLPIWFPELKYVDESGYDHVAGDCKYEHKSFTKGGCIFAPSNMVGSGRKIDAGIVNEHINNTKLTYIITDITEFPVIRVRFVDGKSLIKQYPNCKISKTKKAQFFDLTVD
jgi:hypothetical protein